MKKVILIIIILLALVLIGFSAFVMLNGNDTSSSSTSEKTNKSNMVLPEEEIIKIESSDDALEYLSKNREVEKDNFKYIETSSEGNYVFEDMDGVRYMVNPKTNSIATTSSITHKE